MKNISTFLLMFVVLLGSCVKKEKTDESLSADKAVVTETSDVIYTAMVVRNVSWSSDDSLWNRLETKMPLQYGSFVETGKNLPQPL